MIIDEIFPIIFKAGDHRSKIRIIFKASAHRYKIQIIFKASAIRQLKINFVGGNCFLTCSTMFQKLLRHVKFLEHFKMGKVLEHYV